MTRLWLPARLLLSTAVTTLSSVAVALVVGLTVNAVVSGVPGEVLSVVDQVVRVFDHQLGAEVRAPLVEGLLGQERAGVAVLTAVLWSWVSSIVILTGGLLDSEVQRMQGVEAVPSGADETRSSVEASATHESQAATQVQTSDDPSPRVPAPR